ncbi:MAG: tetratricopeptide repeat protein [Chitinophagales bacterium]
MSRNQIIVISACAVVCLGIYLFADTAKPKGAGPDSGHQGAMPPQMPPQQSVEALNIEEYVSGLEAANTNATAKQNIEKRKAAEDFAGLAEEYTKLDKPLAVAYYLVKAAQKENTVKAYTKAGDYSAQLTQTAPDEKAHRYLMDNVISSYEKAVELDSNQVENKLRLAGAYIEGSQNPMQGVAILRNIVAKDSNNVDAQLMLARFGIVSGQYDKAIARLEKVLYLQPQNTEALLLMAQAYEDTGLKPKAIEMLERCKKTIKDADVLREIDKKIEDLKKQS